MEDFFAFEPQQDWENGPVPPEKPGKWGNRGKAGKTGSTRQPQTEGGLGPSAALGQESTLGGFANAQAPLAHSDAIPLSYGASAPAKPLPRKAGRRVRVKYSNKTKVLLCYLLCWALALLIPLALLYFIYPYQLVGTAPHLAENIVTALPFTRPWLEAALTAATVTPAMNSAAIAQAMAFADTQWQVFVAGCFAVCWLLSLLVQLFWRGMYRRPMQAARAARRAVHTYRISFLVVLAVNLVGALLLFFIGVRFISGKTLWDWLMYTNGFVLNWIAAFLCYRLAAPPAISGKHGFFVRL